MSVDVERLVGAVTREVSTRTVDGEVARVLVARRSYDSAIDRLWEAVTVQGRVSRCMGKVTGDLHLGGRFSIENNASGDITACDAPKHFALTWEINDDKSWVEVWLKAVGPEVTELTLEHVAHVKPDFWKEYGPGATGVGWELALSVLEGLIGGNDESKPHPFQDETFFETEEGKRFVRSCSEAWGEVAVEAGDEAEAARAAAARTAAFYGA
eukprot:CAMPEP_0171071124 /NCGR_PEP_ID=MMETSP0766_2-20121228/10146_1 /TAXON_ID=439317 /ORGANISM="Gambierdiscus australes, Strain CAWD 149" /LENGTH=211 /DNA_ID=CAMNT_0011527653 /DNA_START=40 /DNA_END=675 /DNA_ORIENTATION=-